MSPCTAGGVVGVVVVVGLVAGVVVVGAVGGVVVLLVTGTVVLITAVVKDKELALIVVVVD